MNRVLLTFGVNSVYQGHHFILNILGKLFWIEGCVQFAGGFDCTGINTQGQLPDRDGWQPLTTVRFWGFQR